MKRFIFALAALLFATTAYGQNAGTVTNHAFAIGKGPGVTGYTSLLCNSAQLAVGQTAASPICRTMSGDATFSAAGALTLATVNANVGTFGDATHVPQVTLDAKGRVAAASNVLITGTAPGGPAGGDLTGTYPNPTLAAIIAAGGPTGSATVAPVITYDAKGRLTAVSSAPITPAIGSITGISANCPAWLASASSANLRACMTDETGTGFLYFQNGDLGTPSAGDGSNITSLNGSNISSGTVAVARGGTGLGSGTSGGVLYFSGSGTIASSGVLGANLLVQGGGAGVALSTFTLGGDCTFTTPNITCTKVNGVTFPSSMTSGGIPYASSTSAIASSALLTANAIMLGGGAGVAPFTLGSLGTTSTVLHGNAAGAPTFGAVVSADMNITTTSCTNQFVTAISAGGVGTCTTPTLAGAQFANQGTTTTVLHGNAGGNPSFGAVSLTADVSNILPIANGGTGTASGPVVTVKKQIFTADGTYTPSTGMLYAIVECVGGGGGGGGVAGTVLQIYAAGGGGGGNYSRAVVTAATIGASKAVVIGAGGAGGAAGANDGSAGSDTTLGATICVGKGGSGGFQAATTSNPARGGSGGIAGTGDFTVPGQPGFGGVYSTTNNIFTAFNAGGSSLLGPGALAPQPLSGGAVAGTAATPNTGGGGAGATSNAASNAAGGNGGSGIMFVTEFNSQ